MNKKSRNVFVLILFFLVLAGLAFIDLPGNTKLAGELQNTGHTLVFGLLSLLVLNEIRNSDLINVKNIFTEYAIVLLICFIAGVSVELLQLLFQRDADTYDVLRDTAGIVSFLGLYFLIDQRAKTASGNNRKKILSIIFLISSASLVLALLPLASLANHYYSQSQAFPVITDFSSCWYTDFVRVDNATLKIVKAPSKWESEAGAQVARLTLHDSGSPKIAIDEPGGNWTKYHNLNFKIYSASTVPYALVVRVHDRQHNQEHRDRFNREIRINPGENDFSIALQDIQAAPAGRQMDMTNIAGIILFSGELKKEVELYLGNVWLD